MRKIYTITSIILMVFFAFSTAYGWSGREHYWINLAACIHLEDKMPGFNEYGRKLAEMGYLPDVWKGADPAEGNRHYIDLEPYGFPDLVLDRENPGLLDPVTGTYSPSEGIAPWVIMDTLTDLTLAMEATNWTAATEIAAAMGHYVGDIHMPLHVTDNFDGQKTGNKGVHGRWESEMPRKIKHSRYIKKRKPEYLEDPWAAITNWLISAHQYITPIIDADTKATQYTDGDYTSQEYFEMLWEETEDIFAGQRNRAAQDLASLWYTAWINAGQPPIPPLPENISELSIHGQDEPSRIQYSSWIFFILLAISATLVIWKGIKK